MNFNKPASKAEQNTILEKISKRMAYHQAGYAGAVYLGNQQKQLPPIHFQVVIKPQLLDREPSNRLTGIFEGIFNKYAVIVEGGRFIQNLPLCFSGAVQNLSGSQQAEYRCAFETNVTNLLVGALAEAKYIALRDDETFNAKLVHFKALHFYNGITEIELVNNYMECYLPNETEREQKLADLFLAAFDFVDDNSNWRKISNLAEFIQRQTKTGVLYCEEVISLLDSGLPLSKTSSFDLQTMEYV